MKKIETIWHHLLNEALTRKVYRHTQQELARRFRFSLSTVHHALKIPVQMGAIRKESKFFLLQNFKKLLYYWASVRALQRDIVYRASIDKPIGQIKGEALPDSVFAGYFAAHHHLGEAPADYEKAHWYLAREDQQKARERFPQTPRSKRTPNVFFLLKPDPFPCDGPYTTLPLTFVDIWNLDDWYAQDFIKALEEKIDGLLS